jgi:hypothetical protein
MVEALGIAQASEAHQMTRLLELPEMMDRLQTCVTALMEHGKQQRALLDRLLTCVPGPDSKGYKLAEIMKIAEEWNQIR